MIERVKGNLFLLLIGKLNYLVFQHFGFIIGFRYEVDDDVDLNDDATVQKNAKFGGFMIVKLSDTEEGEVIYGEDEHK